MDLNIVGDSTDPRGTQRPKEVPLEEEYHEFHLVQIPDRPYELQLPPGIHTDDVYALFSLFFIN